MTLKIRILSLVLVLLCCVQWAQAQDFQMGFSGSYSAPKGEFQQNLEHRGLVSMGFKAGYRPKKLPLRFGLDLEVGTYYSQQQRENYTAANYQHSVADICYSNNVFNYGVYTRFEPLRGTMFRPYLEAKAGNSFFYSKWTATDPFQNSNADCPGYLDSKTVYKNTTAYYGLGAGTTINLLANSCCEFLRKNGLLLDLNVSYISGGQVGYMLSADRQSGTVNPTPDEAHNHGGAHVNTPGELLQYGKLYHSTTNRISYQIGFIFQF